MISPAKSRQNNLLLFRGACDEQVEVCATTTEINAVALLVPHAAFNGYEAVKSWYQGTETSVNRNAFYAP